MKQIGEAVYVGGFGSDQYRVDAVCEKLSEYVDHEVVGVPFRVALQDKDRLADFVNGRHLITHSAGSLAIPYVRPASLLSIAPPIPVSFRQLAWRSQHILRHEISRSIHDHERAQHDARSAHLFLRELGRHAIGNFGVIPEITRFNVFHHSQQLADQAIPTRLAFMDEDEFFWMRSSEYNDGLLAKSTQLEVVTVPGYHCDFTRRPIEVLEHIAQATLAESTSRSVKETSSSESRELPSTPIQA